MKSLKWFAAVVTVVAIAVGAALLAVDNSQPAHAQTAPSGQAEALISQQTGLSLDAIHAIQALALASAANQGSAQGVLTADQADKIRHLTPGPILDRLLSALTTSTGAEANDVITALQSGQSLTQIAADHGVQRDVLRSQLSASLQAEIATDQGAGLLTPQQGTMLSDALNANIDQLIDDSN